jgi:hypothetical protein
VISQPGSLLFTRSSTPQDTLFLVGLCDSQASFNVICVPTRLVPQQQQQQHQSSSTHSCTCSSCSPPRSQHVHQAQSKNRLTPFPAKPSRAAWQGCTHQKPCLGSRGPHKPIPQSRMHTLSPACRARTKPRSSFSRTTDSAKLWALDRSAR